MRDLKVLFEDENWVAENVKLYAYKCGDLHINIKFNLQKLMNIYDCLNNYRIFKYKDELFKITTKDFKNLFSTPSLIVLLINFNKIDYEFTDDEDVRISVYFNNEIEYLSKFTMDINNHITLFCELNFEDFDSLGYYSKITLIKYIKQYLLRGIDHSINPSFYLSDILKSYLSDKNTDILTINKLKEDVLSECCVDDVINRLINKRQYIQNKLNKIKYEKAK